MVNRFEEEKNIQDERGNPNEEYEGHGHEGENNWNNMYDDENDVDDEQRMLDQRVPQIVNQFFEQNSDQRFNYLQGLKQLLTR